MARLTEESGDRHETDAIAMPQDEGPDRHRYVLEAPERVKGTRTEDSKADPSPAGGSPFFCDKEGINHTVRGDVVQGRS